MCIRARALGTLPLILGLTLQLGCSRRRDPQAAFDHAVQTLRRGDAAAAASEAEKDSKDFYTAGPEWAWKFTLLRARISYRRGMNDDVLKVIASESAPLPPGELTVQKLR